MDRIAIAIVALFRSGTDPMSVLILLLLLLLLLLLFNFLLFLFLLERPSSKKPKAPSFKIRSGYNLAGLFLK